MRIRGHIGEWPVDLTLELDPTEWAMLAGRAVEPAEAPVNAAAPVAQPRGDDVQWLAAKKLLRKAGSLDGPALLEQLEGLSGSTGAGKRLLVRLRHSSEVKVESGADAPVYHWVG
ncbi:MULTISPECIES: hypothetical protein [unclassified Pseudomonas]|uniref:hypothetical protein n=1 Tax=unclassified Pseudomonas TaxID=196821 RepID=UPI0021CA941C|nr:MULTISPECIES: hypothetical protein [unclassified Pseudomonas]MCU1731366.1 hypothetical protein [Pseudomonas sp. 20P_3.2_Bac4]MCU1746888.1 hypothetical protein [Pseudomonas sp. 20P_3.2_Bac5]